uniref:Uncharacterized protein n=1 Tax=Anguilla anguilla TaxID=7936 RepID=A0A0E9TS89_ANGAN
MTNTGILCQSRLHKKTMYNMDDRS